MEPESMKPFAMLIFLWAFVLPHSSFLLVSSVALSLTPAERGASLMDPAQVAVDALACSSRHFSRSGRFSKERGRPRPLPSS
jgi:hypothetical protein